ncbi:hypothetical protein [Undibacterium sp. TC4M20W]|uniref:hypothetical protein n=1 Tax=Undibacterium sp. TC4M20W TaxID=3413052 RepID=UPI003BF48791
MLVEKMHMNFPDFVLKETPSRKAADEIKPSAKPIKFVWSSIDKLTFSIEFLGHPRQDYFEGYCEWSEAGKSKTDAYWNIQPFTDETIASPKAVVLIQVLSGPIAGFKPEEIAYNWSIWKPSVTIEDINAYQAEFMAEEMRQIGDPEAKMRVEVAVDRAIADVKRCALPWFEKKLDWYKKNKVAN